MIAYNSLGSSAQLLREKHLEPALPQSPSFVSATLLSRTRLRYFRSHSQGEMERLQNEIKSLLCLLSYVVQPDFCRGRKMVPMGREDFYQSPIFSSLLHSSSC